MEARAQGPDPGVGADCLSRFIQEGRNPVGIPKQWAFLPVLGVWLAALLTLRADSGVLVGAGEEWHCWQAGPGGSALPDGWTAPAFDDSRWPVRIPGAAGFGDETAVVPITAPGAMFLRKTFVLETVVDVERLWLRAGSETRFRIWLNGVEAPLLREQGVLGRLNQLNWWRLRSSMDTVDLTAQVPLLKPGTNVIAAECEGFLLGSVSGVTWPVLLANFTRGPYLESTSPTQTLISWRTADRSIGRVDYGLTPALGSRWIESYPSTNHVAHLAGLQPGTPYYYRIGGPLPGVAGGLGTFRTLKAAGRISFAVVGDTGLSTPAQGAIARVLRQARPELVIHAGDIIYGGFSDARADDCVFNYYQPQMREIPWFFAIGNHDFNCCAGPPDYHPSLWRLHAVQFQRLFRLPVNPVTGTTHFYSFDHGDAHFAVLHNPWFANYRFTAQTDQYQWLQADLAASAKPWKFLVLHSPLAHSGAHAADDHDRNGIPDQQDVMDLLLPVAQKHGVQVVFGAHEHHYERFLPTNGVHHLLSGGGGGLLYPFVTRHPASAQFRRVYNCLKVEVDGPTLVCEALDVRGAVFDSFSVTREVPAARVWAADWNSPGVESGPADDGGGNRVGQRFDFTGPPVPALAGEFSNLGRFYVNNDGTNLYLGFQGVLTYPGNTVFLFVETPGLKGVGSMTGLGNGRVDPAGQGADGLDYLQNLSFSNFTPSVACLLGDEYADGQFRSFARSNCALNTGQGVFRLDPSVSDLPGARLQQFNRSPQPAPGAPRQDGSELEQNADFIEIAIPMAALGGLKPGDTIKAAAVVGGLGVDFQQRRRQLDSGFLGAALRGRGMDPAVLEGVAVRLAVPPARAQGAVAR